MKVLQAKRLRKGSRPDQILRYLALGSGLLILSAIAPQAGARLVAAGVKSYFRKKRFQRERFLKDLRNLQKRKLVDFKEFDDGRIELKLDKNGKIHALSYQLENLSLKKPRRWDGEWRLVMFDIPHEFKAARDAMREKLSELGFYHIQKSVFLTPFPCEGEIDFVATVFDVRKFVLILYISHFEGEEKLKNHFGLS